MPKAPVIHHPPTGAGKGDKSRVNNLDAYRQNFDRIDWRPDKTRTEQHGREGEQK